MGSKTQTATTQQSTTPTNLSGIQSIFNAVQSAAATPYTPYTGELTAGTNAQQAAGTNTINGALSAGNGYYGNAANLLQSGSTPLSASQIQNYQSPYTQQVVNATQAQFNNQNAQQQSQLVGNAAMQGASGGDRQAVAQANLAGQQQLAQAPTIANLYNTGYNNAVTTAEQQQQNQLAAAGQYGTLGNSAVNSALNAGNAQIGAGTLQQQTQQAQDTAALQQYMQQQGYPFQTAAYLEQYGLPSALAQGSSSSGVQNTQGPNLLTQLLGLGTAGLTAYSDKRVKENIEKVGETYDKQPIYKFNYKGSPLTQIGLMAQDVEHSHPDAVGESNGIKTVDYDKATQDSADRGKFASGGYVTGAMPFASPMSYVPVGSASNAQLSTPSLQYAKPASSSTTNTSSLGKLFGTAGKTFSGETYGGGNALTDEYGGSSSNPAPGLDASDYGPGFKRGGFIDTINHIRHAIKRSRGGTVGTSPFTSFADGGDVFGDDNRAIGYDLLRQGMGPQDPFGDDNRAIGGDLLRRGMGTQAPDTIPGGEAPPAVVNPDQPFRLAGPEAMDAWRKGVDQPNPALVADSGQPGPDPSVASVAPANPMTAALPPQITNPDGVPDDSSQPSQALAYSGGPPASAAPMAAPSASTPQADSDSRFGSFNPFGLSDKAREAIIAGALGVAASRSPFALSAIGEGGLKGMNTYSEATKAEQDAADKKLSADQAAQRLLLQMQQQKFSQASAPLISDGKGGMMPNPAYLALKKQESDISQKDNWAPIGTVMVPTASGEMVPHPLIMNKADRTTVDAVTGKPPAADARIAAVNGKGADPAQVGHVVDGIASGRQPPTLTGLYGMSGAVRSGLDEKGFDLAKAQMEWKQAEKQIATLNGPQMTRFVGLAKSVDSTIDEVRELSKEMNNSGIPILNRAKLAAYMQAEGNSSNGQLAARYIGAVNTLKEEFANLANGGYAPTEPAWELANKQINGDYGVKQLGASLDEVQRLIRYRVHAIPGLSTNGPGSTNRYTGQTGAANPTAAASPAAPAAQAASGKPQTVIQNGHTYTLQPDGSYK